MSNNFIGCDTKYEEAKTVIFGAPFDGTASYRPGSRFAPDIMRNDSYGLEEYSPYQEAHIKGVCDMGDLEFPFGNKEKVLSIIEDNTKALLENSKIPIMLGGEHLVTLGAIRAMVKHYPELYVIHFDAHADLREDYLGEKLSHATVMRRVCELIKPGRLYQYGIRSGEKEEFIFAEKYTNMRKFDLNTLESDIFSDKPVYLSIDLDVLDPSCFPGTGTPEPGGITFNELLYAILKLKELNIVGCDITELAPHYDQSGISTACACKILREILIMLLNAGKYKGIDIEPRGFATRELNNDNPFVKEILNTGYEII